MGYASEYQLNDVYMTSGLSIIFVGAFLTCTSLASGHERRLRRALVAVWSFLEVSALILSILHDKGIMELPRVHYILATISMCGAVNIQIPVTLVYTMKRIPWWKIALGLECFEVIILCVLGMIRSLPFELTYIIPFTSQTLAVCAILDMFDDLPGREALGLQDSAAQASGVPASKELADRILATGLIYAMISLLVLGLSLGGLLPRHIYVQCCLFILNLAIIFPLGGFEPTRFPELVRSWARRHWNQLMTSLSLTHGRSVRESLRESYQVLPSVGGSSIEPPTPPNAYVRGMRLHSIRVHSDQ